MVFAKIFARVRSPRLAARWASLCRVLPSPFQRLGVANLIAWFTFIYRTTGLHAVGVIGSVALLTLLVGLTDSRGSTRLRLDWL